jgi:hypothetical protein
LLQQFARPRQISLLHGGGGPGRTALRRRAVQRPRIIAVVETQQRLARMDAAAKVDPALDDPARHFETDLAFEGGPDFAGIGCADAGIGANALDGHGASFIPDLRLIPTGRKQQQRDRYDMGKTCHSIPMGKGRRGRPVHARPREWSRSATI